MDVGALITVQQRPRIEQGALRASCVASYASPLWARLAALACGLSTRAFASQMQRTSWTRAAPLPHTYVSAAELPEFWDIRNISGESYATWDKNQHIPQVSLESCRLAKMPAPRGSEGGGGLRMRSSHHAVIHIAAPASTAARAGRRGRPRRSPTGSRCCARTRGRRSTSRRRCSSTP